MTDWLLMYKTEIENHRKIAPHVPLDAREWYIRDKVARRMERTLKISGMLAKLRLHDLILEDHEKTKDAIRNMRARHTELIG